MHNLFLQRPFSVFCFGFLLVSIISLWSEKRIKLYKLTINFWFLMYLISIIFGVLSHSLSSMGLVALVALGLLCYQLDKKVMRPLSTAVMIAGVVLLSVALAAHYVPGFYGWRVVESLTLSRDSLPFPIYLSFDKAAVGLMILGFGFPLIRRYDEWVLLLKVIAPILIVALSVLSAILIVTDYVRWDVKLPDVFFIWAVKNLFFTCVAEEAFFRGFLQQRLSEKLENYRFGNEVSLLFIAIIFGLVHFSAGLTFVVIAMLAGIFYGYAYQKTQRIEAAILCHFIVNTFHFVFLSYPALANT